MFDSTPGGWCLLLWIMACHVMEVCHTHCLPVTSAIFWSAFVQKTSLIYSTVRTRY